MENDMSFDLVRKGFAYSILSYLFEHKQEEVYTTQIIKQYPGSGPNISTVLAKLVSLGFVEKKVSKQSKRIKHIFLTQKGERLASLLVEANIIIDKSVNKVNNGKGIPTPTAK